MKYLSIVSTLSLICFCLGAGPVSLESSVHSVVSKPWIPVVQPTCNEFNLNVGGACICYLISINKVQLFKRISVEGLRKICEDKFGPSFTWSWSCSILTQEKKFSVKTAIKAVQFLVDECENTDIPLCGFSVIGH